MVTLGGTTTLRTWGRQGDLVFLGLEAQRKSLGELDAMAVL